MAYILELPSETSIHPVFHVSQLKKALGNHPIAQEGPPILTENFEWVVTPAEVFAANQEYSKILVGWKGLPEHEATWEKVEDFKSNS